MNHISQDGDSAARSKTKHNVSVVWDGEINASDTILGPLFRRTEVLTPKA